jgi:hypothetical protein
LKHALKIFAAVSGIGVGGGILGFLLLMPILGLSSASGVMPYLVGSFSVVGYFVAARHLL